MASNQLDASALLKDATITGVKPLNKELGRGAYGRVFTVKYRGVVCAAKEIHPYLSKTATPADEKAIVDNFARECHQCSLVRHPNIVQFLGVYYSSKKSNLPIMVMELMDTSLSSFVKNHQSEIAMTTKVSILCDVSLGLSHLHTRKPVVIHRDLSSNNVLLTSQRVAKIGDLGVAKVVQATNSRQTRSRLTKAPGTVDFMPPETLEAKPLYSTAVNVFSFAGVALHVFAEEWPKPCVQRRQDPVTKKLVAVTEVERRQKYLDKIPEGAAALKHLFEVCLDDDPNERPPIQEVSEMIETIKVFILQLLSQQSTRY